MNKKTMFYNSFLQLKTEKEVRQYLRDLLTIPEINEFADRLAVADMLNNKVTYTEIVKTTTMSSTTIARISKWLKNGRNGYKLILNRLHHHVSSPPRREA
jgi:TrpR-related protein YerC/YecD